MFFYGVGFDGCIFCCCNFRRNSTGIGWVIRLSIVTNMLLGIERVAFCCQLMGIVKVSEVVQCTI